MCDRSHEKRKTKKASKKKKLKVRLKFQNFENLWKLVLGYIPFYLFICLSKKFFFFLFLLSTIKRIPYRFYYTNFFSCLNNFLSLSLLIVYIACILLQLLYPINFLVKKNFFFNYRFFLFLTQSFKLDGKVMRLLRI